MAIADLKDRLRAKFSRRSSTSESLESGGAEEAAAEREDRRKKKARSVRSRASVRAASSLAGETSELKEGDEKQEEQDGEGDVITGGGEAAGGASSAGRDVDAAARDPGLAPQLSQLQRPPSPRRTASSTATTGAQSTATASTLVELTASRVTLHEFKHDSSSTADLPTPNTEISPVPEEEETDYIEHRANDDHDAASAQQHDLEPQLDHPASSPTSAQHLSGLQRRQSLLPHQQTKLIRTLLETDLPPPTQASHAEYFASHGPATISANMVSRKIWVKRPGASPTLVTIHEDDLVDDVRDMILRKYANSLGRAFDAPDVTLRVVPRENNRQERTLGPEEPMGRTLDSYFPGGQTVDEALIIDVPLRRTPKPSPQPMRGYYDHDGRPAEAGTDYFPPMPVHPLPSPHLTNALPIGLPNGQSHHSSITSHAMSVLTTGHVPALPSPGSTRRHHRDGRPRAARHSTSSPTILSGAHTSSTQLATLSSGTQLYSLPPRVARSRTHSSASEASAAPPTAPPLPTPPAVGPQSEIQRVATPPPRVSSPRPKGPRQRKNKKSSSAITGNSKLNHPTLPAGMLNGGVPPINVLIVEDNIINLKLLEAFMKRLKVRWQTAMNGRDAVLKWRAGGFHLVLMDIQLPIMSGLEATKEIRRLERLNSIGVFSSSASSKGRASLLRDGDEQHGDGKREGEGKENEGCDGLEEKDRLPSTVLFKSPVIIVALTASSLQSDRHEALAAGCNDFLTKPVNFVWLERKVMEWGCMQALIDFDGWRKWKDFSQNGGKGEDGDKSGSAGGDKSGDGGAGAGGGAKKTDKKKKGRLSLGSLGVGNASGGGGESVSTNTSASRVPLVGEA